MKSLSRCLLLSLVLVTTLTGTASESHAQKIHCLIVADQSEWAGWGEYLPNILMDMIHMRTTLENNVPARQLNLRSLAIELDPGSPPDILRELQQFSVGPQDTFMFYFTGHGGADDRGHYLNLERGKLYRSEVIKLMKEKKPRLAVVLTDCCNVRSDKFAYLAPYVETEPPRNATPLFQSLFFDESGAVDINGSSPGESAFFFVEKDEFDLPKGSLFSRTFTDYLHDRRAQSGSWDKLLQDVSIQVHKSFRRNYPSGAKSTVKGQSVQRRQSVYAITYPGMPARKGPRTGITIRDHEGTGALIVQVRLDYPGAEVFDLSSEQYVSLAQDQVIVSANGQPVTNANEFNDIVKRSPQILRLTISNGAGGNKDYLMRLRY